MHSAKMSMSAGSVRPPAEQIAGVLCILIGTSVLAGWLFSEVTLVNWGSGLPAARPAAALVICVLGAAIASPGYGTAWTSYAGWGVFAVSAASLAMDAAGLGSGVILRPAPAASLSLMLCGYALASSDNKEDRIAVCFAAFGAGFIGAIVTLGYLTGLQAMLQSYRSFDAISAPVALSLVLLSWGVLSRALRRPEQLSPRPLWFYLTALALAVPFPLFLFSIHAGFSLSAVQQIQSKEQLLFAARRVSQTVDREIQGEFETLHALAASPSLMLGDLVAFRQQALATLSVRGGGAILLFDRTANVILDTRITLASPAPLPGVSQTVQRLFGGAAHSVSGVTSIGGSARPSVVIALPIKIGGETRYALARAIELANLWRVLEESIVPSGWRAGVSDAVNRIIARSAENDRFMGQPLSISIERGTEGAQGVIETVDLENQPSWHAYAWSDFTGWRSAVWAHKAALDSSARTLWRSILLLGILAIAIALAMAWIVGSLLARSFAVPHSVASSLGHGVIQQPLSTPVEEANRLSSALYEAVTRRVAAEAAVDDVRRFNQGLVEAAPNLLYIFDISSAKTIYLSPQIKPLLGYEPGEIQGRSGAEFEALFHDDDRLKIEQHHRTILTSSDDGPFEIEYRIRHKDGSWRWLESRDVVYARRDDGTPSQILGSAQDITEHKVAQDRIQESERRLASVLQALPIGVALVDSEGRLLIGNDFYRRFINGVIPSRDRNRHADWEAHREDGSRVPPAEYPGARALRGESVWPGVEFRYHGDAARGPIWIRIAALPLRNDDGTVRGAVLVLDDIDQEKKAQDALRQSEERYRFLVERTSDLVFRIRFKEPLPLDLAADDQIDWIFREGVVAEANDGFARAHGYAYATEAVGRSLVEFMPRTSHNIAMVRGLVEAGHAVVEARSDEQDAGGHRRVMLTSIVGRKEGGRVFEYLGAARDITERIEAEEALSANELHLRLAQEAAGIGSWEMDLRTGVGVWSPRARELIGADAGEEPTRAVFISRVHPEDVAAIETAQARAASGDGDLTYRVEYRVLLQDGRIRWIEEQGRALRGTNGDIERLIGASRDATERKQHEEQLQLLMREVNHRSKNLLSLVLAIARQTSAGDPKEFARRFSERIQALAANQDLLVRSQWQGIEIEALTRAQLSHFADLIGTRIRLEGQHMLLKPAAAQGLGLALHELATNAGKYGALSNDTGVVSIGWSVTDGEFAISWDETGGPVVDMPTRKGFGSTVIISVARLSVDGEVDLRYRPSGLTWRLTCQASKALEQQEGGKLDQT